MGESKSRKKKKKQRNGPPFLSDFGNKSAELLRKDYGTESKVVRFSTLTQSGLAFHLSAMYKKQPSVSFMDSPFEFGFSRSRDRSVSNFTVKTGLSKLIAPSTTLKASMEIPDFSPKMSARYRLRREFSPSLTAKALFKLPDYEACNISLRYLREKTALLMGIGGNGVTFQASRGSPSFAVGIQTTHQTDSDRFRIGVQQTLLGDTASLIYSSKGKKIRARFLHSLGEEKKMSAVLDISLSLSSGKTKFTAAGSWAVDDQTVVNARLDHHGTLKAFLKRNMGKHNSAVSISAEFDVKNGRETPKIGFAVVI